MLKKSMYTILFVSVVLLASGYDSIADENKYCRGYVKLQDKPVDLNMWSYK